jgi:hypothetical protein
MSMTSNAYRRVLLLCLSCAALACSSTHVEECSSGSHWLACDDDDECEEAREDATCGDDGYCVDPFGERIRVMLSDGGGAGGQSGEGGAGGAGSGGESGEGGAGAGGESGSAGNGGSGATSGAGGGGADAGRYDPCDGKPCGSSCRECDPADPECTETTEVKTCDAFGVCSGGVHECQSMAPRECAPEVGVGDECRYAGDAMLPQCCSDKDLLLCTPTACTDGIPGSCFGTYQVVPSDTCLSLQACRGKACGDRCEICSPDDPSCGADVYAECDPSGLCIGGQAECNTPDPTSCDLDGTGPNVCELGQVCCAVGRCGPVVQDQGICEDADPDTGACAKCACEDEPGGCPICNSPDTPIATPDGERAIADLVEGDLVFSMHQGVLMPVPVLALRSVRVQDHAVVRVELDSGRFIEVSGSHPTAEGRRLDAVVPGDRLGEARVVSVELVPYTHERTYDILPASDSATYLAGGALLGSTLAR